MGDSQRWAACGGKGVFGYSIIITRQRLHHFFRTNRSPFDVNPAIVRIVDAINNAVACDAIRATSEFRVRTVTKSASTLDPAIANGTTKCRELVSLRTIRRVATMDDANQITSQR